jgi:predicted flap endonuclease-1-like 5' DNA nuclease
MQLGGLGTAAADKLLGEGVRFVNEIRAWSPETIAGLTARTGLSAESLARWRKAAGGR